MRIASLLAVAAFVAPLPAFAHPRLVSATPKPNLTTAPTARVQLAFSERLVRQFSGADVVMTAMPGMKMNALMRMEGVQDVAVVGVPDERLGEVGKAYVVGSATPDDVIAFARERLANFKVPRHVEHVDALPRNLSGKVLKNELRN